MLSKINRNVFWPLSGFMLAVIFGGLNIYTEFFRDDRPSIQFEILSDSSVLDVREEVSDLEIIHAGADLRREGQSLRVIVVRISNTGKEDILSDFYDDEAPLGISVKDGELIGAEIQDASETYLSERVTLHIRDSSEVIFSPVILASRSYFSVRVLIKHSESTTPAISPVGKVARVSSISLVPAPISQPAGFWRQTFGGSIWSHIVRIVAYPILLILLLASVVAPITFISDRNEKRGRMKKVGMFKRNSEHEFRSEYDVFFDSYAKLGSYYLHQVDKLLADDVDLNDVASTLRKKVAPSEGSVELEQMHQLMFRYETDDKLHLSMVRKLFREGIIEDINGHYSCNEGFKDMFRDFQKFLSLVAD